MSDALNNDPMEILNEEAFLPALQRQPGEEMPEWVTIAIPTYNRSNLLKICLESALTQDYPYLRILVLDNASPDDTQATVGSFEDERIVCLRSETNVGAVSNWNRGIAANTSPYLTILQDDDALHPQFVCGSLRRLKQFPNAALSYALARYFDANGVTGQLQPPYGMPDDPDVVDGKAYLHQIVSGRGWYIHSSTVLMRASAVAAVGLFDRSHTCHAYDFNMYVRLAAKFDIAVVPKELSYVRAHPEQVSESAFRSKTDTGPLGYTAERIDALADLLGSERAQEPSYRRWLTERLLFINAEQSYYAYSLLPGLYFDWHERRQAALREIVALIPAGESFILVDEDHWATGGEVAGRRAIPFPVTGGVYWGPPADDESAIAGLEDKLKAGINIVIIGWPAFWWLEHYGSLNAWLCARGQRIFSSSRLVAFRLSAPLSISAWS